MENRSLKKILYEYLNDPYLLFVHLNNSTPDTKYKVNTFPNIIVIV